MRGIRLGRWIDWVRAGAGPHQIRYLALAVAWLLLWRVSALMEYAPHATIWFPPAGLSFAALLLLGWRAVPVLMTCAVLVTFWVDQMYQTDAPWPELLLSGVLFGAVHCLSYGVGAGLLKRVIRRSAVQSIPSIIIVFLVIGCLSALCAALVGIESLEATGMLDHAAVSGLWLPWWIGDMAGALVLTPLFLGLLSWRYPQIEPWLGGLTFQPQSQGTRAYLIKLLVSVSLLSAVMLLAAHFRYQEVAFGMFFLIIPQMWIVYTESPFRSALSLAAFSTVTALWVAGLGLAEQALVYEFAVCVIAASAYFGFAVPVLIAHNRQLRELALNDGLTKVATKEHFFECAERVLADARRYKRPVSLIVLDIDRFKEINDRFGHAVGDQALIKLARTVEAELRPSDVMGRFGGDEFTLLLPGIHVDQALAMAQRLHRLLQSTLVPGTQRDLSASFGAAGIGPGETPIQAFKRADRRLLDAKLRGRNASGETESDVRAWRTGTGSG